MKLKHPDPKFEIREKIMKEHTSDPLLTPGESLRFLYHWMRLELAILKRISAERSIVKHGRILDQEQDVLVMRHQMEAHL